MQTKIQALLQSRRFWVAVAGVLAVTTESLGITTFEELEDFGTRKSNTRNRRDLEST